MDGEWLIKTALGCGADAAAMVERDSIVLDPMFRSLCADNSCGMYGRCWMCPPDIGPVEEWIARVRAYDKGLLYQTVGLLEDSFDIEGMRATKERLVAVSQRLLDAFRPVLGGDALHLACGGCGLCAVCARQAGRPCIHPDRALPSLEGCGIDVYNTVRSTPLRYVNGPNTVTYFGMVLFSETKDG